MEGYAKPWCFGSIQRRTHNQKTHLCFGEIPIYMNAKQNHSDVTKNRYQPVARLDLPYVSENKAPRQSASTFFMREQVIVC